jgi:endonuclease/exonuclease/phosphatase family metal-dependent hydrolase
MKKFILLLIILTSFNNNNLDSLNLFKDEIKVISYNIRYNNPNDGDDIWENRRSTIVNFILNENPDFIGLQETTHSQLQYLKTKLNNYNYLGVGRDNGKTKGEYSPIFYNKFLYNLKISNTFWLSERPNEISVGWDAAMERICSYGMFEDIKKGVNVWVFNTHFDHIGIIARKNSVDLILSKIKELTKDNDRVIIMGDFNLDENSEPIKKLQKFYSDVNLNIVNQNTLLGTFNNFQINSKSKKRIDYIFQKNFTTLSSVHKDLKTPNGRWASDHHPVISVLKL